MSTKEVRSNEAAGSTSVANLDMKLEVVVIPVSAAPGSAQAMLLAVSDIEAARQQLVAQGVDASEVFHCAEGTACRFKGVGVRIGGRQPNHLSYGSFVSFTDPDGDGWLLQEVTKRLAGRIDSATTTFFL